MTCCVKDFFFSFFLTADPSLKFEGILNKLNLSQGQDKGGWKREGLISRRIYRDVRRWLGKADVGSLSCNISISEGMVQESARKQKGWISTD